METRIFVYRHRKSRAESQQSVRLITSTDHHDELPRPLDLIKRNNLSNAGSRLLTFHGFNVTGERIQSFYQLPAFRGLRIYRYFTQPNTYLVRNEDLPLLKLTLHSAKLIQEILLPTNSV